MPDEHLLPRDTPLRAGDAAPDFTLLDQSRTPWRLSDALKNGDVVLCFYPMDFSPVCSAEMRCATDEMARFAAKGAQVVGVSCDSFFVHKAWAESLGLTQTLLADMRREVCKAFGVYFPDLNISGRATFIMTRGRAGEPRVKWAQPREMKAAMKTDEVLAALS